VDADDFFVARMEAAPAKNNRFICLKVVDVISIIKEVWLARIGMGSIPARALLFRSRQASISMGVGAWLAGTKLAFFPWFGTTSRAPHCQCFLLGDFHGYILHVYSAARWSILTAHWPCTYRILARIPGSLEYDRSVSGL
jgi:hypothetical protein